MSHEKYVIDRFSQRVEALLPEFLRDEAPNFVSFVKAYFEFLESEILTLESQSPLDGVKLEDNAGSILLEPATVTPSPDANTSKVVSETHQGNDVGNADSFKVGEYIYGQTNGSVARIEVINGNTLYIKTVSGNGFSSAEKIEGREGLQTATVLKYKENSILANNRLLDYSDIDHTTEDFIQYFQKDFIPSLDLANIPNKRTVIKHIKDLYQKKGTEESVKFLMRVLYQDDAEVRYPINETMFVSDSSYSQQRRMVVKMDREVLPKVNDKITKYKTDGSIDAEAIVESVYVKDTPNNLYSIEISDNHYGVFNAEDPVTFLDRDGLTSWTGVVKGVIEGFNFDVSSTYIDHGDSGDIILEGPILSGTHTFTTTSKSVVGDSSKYTSELEVGDTLEFTISGTDYTLDVASIIDDNNITVTSNPLAGAGGQTVQRQRTEGGMVLEPHPVESSGALYSINDSINFTGSKGDNSVSKSESVVNDLDVAPITKIYIEDGGQNYNAGEKIVFDDGSADAIIGSVGDELLLEGGLYWGHFEQTAVSGQTVFSGVDNFGKHILFNDYFVKVFVDGNELTWSTDFTFKNDRITLVSALSGGERVEMFTQFNRLQYEDNTFTDGPDYPITLETTINNIRSARIKGGGQYNIPPLCWPGGYIYFADGHAELYTVGENITGTISNAQATILAIEPEDNRIKVKRESTHTGVFQSGEAITGGSSTTEKVNTGVDVATGTGAKLYAYGEDIGRVTSINMQEQGYQFNADGVLDSTSNFPMLIETPTASLSRNLVVTGAISGATGKVISYDSNRHILLLTDVEGCFTETETVNYNSVDTFKILKYSPFDGRGTFKGEGILNEQFLGVKSFLSEDAANIQDGKYYQTHSYVVKVGESINKWRSALKDLIHPSGHIFFGEVAIKNDIGAQMDTIFRPTVVISPLVQLAVPNAFSNVTRDIEIYNKTPNILLEDGYGLQYEDGNYVVGSDDDLMNFVNDPLIVLEEAGVPTLGVSNQTTDFLASEVTNPAGVALGATSEYYDSAFKNRHVNINIIQSHSFAVAQRGTFSDADRHGGEPTVLNIVRRDEGDYLRQEEPFIPSYADDNTFLGLVPERRPSTEGKTYGVYEIHDEELVTETGERLILEEEPTVMKMEPEVDAEVQGDFGKPFIYEDATLNDDGVAIGGEKVLLELATVDEEISYFISERTTELNPNKFLFHEDGDRITFEDGVGIVDEQSSESHSVSFVPFGHTMRTINTISNQNTYKISYYLKQDDGSAFNSGTHGDNIVLEDGTNPSDSAYAEGGLSHILSEETEHEGLRINDLDSYLPKMRVSDYPLHERKRTNIAFSSYVKSA